MEFITTSLAANSWPSTWLPSTTLPLSHKRVRIVIVIKIIINIINRINFSGKKVCGCFWDGFWVCRILTIFSGFGGTPLWGPLPFTDRLLTLSLILEMPAMEGREKRLWGRNRWYGNKYRDNK